MNDSRSNVNKMFWIHCLSPLHIGAGRGTSYIDLPIMREKVTNWPYIPGSSVKGVLRDYYEGYKDSSEAGINKSMKDVAFGAADADDSSGSNSGSLVFTDASLICLPVRSVYGTFAWCTSPMVLARLKRDLGYTGNNGVQPCSPDGEINNESVYVMQNSALIEPGVKPEHRVYLEDLDFKVISNNVCLEIWANLIAKGVFDPSDSWAEEFKKRFCVVSDDVFSFLCQTATQVDARIRIRPDTKTVSVFSVC